MKKLFLYMLVVMAAYTGLGLNNLRADDCPTVTPVRTTYLEDREPSVVVDIPNADPWAWVGIYEKGSGYGEGQWSICWQYVGCLTDNTWTVDHHYLPEGEYEFRLFEDDHYNLVATAEFSVKQGTTLSQLHSHNIEGEISIFTVDGATGAVITADSFTTGTFDVSNTFDVAEGDNFYVVQTPEALGLDTTTGQYLYSWSFPGINFQDSDGNIVFQTPCVSNSNYYTDDDNFVVSVQVFNFTGGLFVVDPDHCKILKALMEKAESDYLDKKQEIINRTLDLKKLNESKAKALTDLFYAELAANPELYPDLIESNALLDDFIAQEEGHDAEMEAYDGLINSLDPVADAAQIATLQAEQAAKELLWTEFDEHTNTLIEALRVGADIDSANAVAAAAIAYETSVHKASVDQAIIDLATAEGELPGSHKKYLDAKKAYEDCLEGRT